MYAPGRAAELVRKIYDSPSVLLTFPNRGRLGKKKGTRELTLSPFPFIVIYQITTDVIYITRILHGAQKWP